MKPTLAIAIAIALSMSACGSSTTAAPATTPTQAQAFRMMSVDEVATGLAAGSLTVLDANRASTYAERHIPNARWVAYDNVTAADLPADATAPVAFYCFNEQCEASHRAAEGAVALGHTNVFVMAAGIEGWQAAGQPIEASAAPATP